MNVTLIYENLKNNALKECKADFDFGIEITFNHLQNAETIKDFLLKAEKGESIDLKNVNLKLIKK